LKHLHNVYTRALIYDDTIPSLKVNKEFEPVYSRECPTRMPHDKRITLTFASTLTYLMSSTYASQ